MSIVSLPIALMRALLQCRYSWFLAGLLSEKPDTLPLADTLGCVGLEVLPPAAAPVATFAVPSAFTSAAAHCSAHVRPFYSASRSAVDFADISCHLEDHYLKGRSSTGVLEDPPLRYPHLRWVSPGEDVLNIYWQCRKAKRLAWYLSYNPFCSCACDSHRPDHLLSSSQCS